MKEVKTQAGISTIITVMVIASAVLIIAVNSAVIGQGELDMSLGNKAGQEARTNAESCINEALRRLKLKSDFLTSGLTLPLDDGLCTIIVSASSSDRQIKASSEINGYYKEINISVKMVTGSLSIYDWREY